MSEKYSIIESGLWNYELWRGTDCVCAARDSDTMMNMMCEKLTDIESAITLEQRKLAKSRELYVIEVDDLKHDTFQLLEDYDQAIAEVR